MKLELKGNVLTDGNLRMYTDSYGCDKKPGGFFWLFFPEVMWVGTTRKLIHAYRRG